MEAASRRIRSYGKGRGPVGSGVSSACPVLPNETNWIRPATHRMMPISRIADRMAATVAVASDLLKNCRSEITLWNAFGAASDTKKPLKLGSIPSHTVLRTARRHGSLTNQHLRMRSAVHGNRL